MTQSAWPCGDHGVGVAIAAIARQPHLRLDAAERFQLLLRKEERRGRQQRRLARSSQRRGDELAVDRPCHPIQVRARRRLLPSPIKRSRVKGWTSMP